jgi:hypothetical protein
LTDAVGAGSGKKFDVLRRFDIAVAILVRRVMVTHAQDVRKACVNKYLPRLRVVPSRSVTQPSTSCLGRWLCRSPARCSQSSSGDRQETTDAGDSPRMGLISYHRAGVAQRQARAAVRASRRIGDALNDVQAQNEQLNELVNQQAEMIERLETELGELRRRIEER